MLMIYEARPNVTVDAAALCLKSGNAVHPARRLGGAAHQRRRSPPAVAEGLGAAGLPAAVGPARPDRRPRAPDRALAASTASSTSCIPRGGEGLIRFVAEHARVPVVKHYQGVCHVFVDAAADLERRRPPSS